MVLPGLGLEFDVEFASLIQTFPKSRARRNTYRQLQTGSPSDHLKDSQAPIGKTHQDARARHVNEQKVPFLAATPSTPGRDSPNPKSGRGARSSFGTYPACSTQ